MTNGIQWGIVATVAEPAPLVLAFVAHPLHLGATEIHVYLDDPDDPVGDILDWIPPVRVTRCDRAHWQGLGIWRPKRHNNRQSFNATHAQSVTELPFLLSCDADEFLRPRSDVSAQLAEIPEHANWMKVFNLERAMVRGVPQRSIFDGVFKVHYQGQDHTPLRCSDMAPNGFTGHAAGKPFVRTHLGMNIGIHVPRFGHIKDRVVPTHYPADQLELIHFDGLTPLHWAAKFLRQAANTPDRLGQLPPFRIAQWQEIFSVIEDPEALRRLYDKVNGYDPGEVAALEEDGYIVREVFDPSAAIHATFPGETLDLSPDAFDTVLRPSIGKWKRLARKNGVLE